LFFLCAVSLLLIFFRGSFREKGCWTGPRVCVCVCYVCLCVLMLLLLLLCSLNQLLLCSFVLYPSLSLGTLSSIIENYIIIMYSTRFFFMFSLGLVFFLFQAFLLLLHTGFIFLMQIFMITPRWWCSFIRFLPTSVLMPKYAKFLKNCSEEHGRPDCVLHLKGVFINVHFLVIRLDCFLLRVGQNIEFSACFTIRKLRVRKINSKGIRSHENFFTMVITLEITHFIMLIKTLNFQAHELASTKHFKHNHWLTGCNWSSTKAPLSVLTLKKVISCFPLQIEVTCVLYLFSQHIWTDELIGSGSSISARKWPI